MRNKTVAGDNKYHNKIKPTNVPHPQWVRDSKPDKFHHPVSIKFQQDGQVLH